jgi:hypothetical protein
MKAINKDGLTLGFDLQKTVIIFYQRLLDI